MAKEKTNKIFGISSVLVIILAVAVIVLGVMYFIEKQNSADKVSAYAKLKSDYNSTIARNSDLNNKLQQEIDKSNNLEQAANDSKGEAKLLSNCSEGDCLLSSDDDAFFGLAEIKGYYQEKCVKVEEGNEFGLTDFCCPFIALTDASTEMIDGLKSDGGSWISKNDDGSIKSFMVDFGTLSESQKNKIKISTKDKPVDLTMFADQIRDGIGFEGAQCLSPWRVLAVK